MRFSVVCAVSTVLLVLFMVQSSKAWLCLICLGKRSLPENQVCPFTCKRYCPAAKCRVVCASECILKQLGATDKVLRPIPPVFEVYDQDQDGFITLQEFMKTLKTDRQSSIAPMKLADDSGDGKLSQKEFAGAPWSGTGKPKTTRDVSGQDEQDIW